MHATEISHNVRAFATRRWVVLAVLAMIAVTLSVPSPSAATVTTPLDEPGWHLMAHMSDSGGMFGGNTELAQGASFGTFVADPGPSTPDFQRAFTFGADEILFITGDGAVWGRTSYPQLRALIDGRNGQFGPNLAFETNAGPVTGNVLSRPTAVEDPWISIAEGGHSDGIGQGLIVWGENDWGTHNLSVGHVQLKNTRGGINVYVRTSAPEITAVDAPVDPVLIGSPVSVTATFSDVSAFDSHSCAVDFGDGTVLAGTVDPTTSTCSSSHAYPDPGVYTVTATVTDSATNEATSSATVVVYDPDGGFVTGGGWIDSPAGAYTADPDLTGKASFGFVAKYKKGANVPDGNTQFQFNAGELNFHSTSYNWLVVSGGTARFRGEGTVNGQGSYTFVLFADDDDPDTFRIHIWGDTGTLYDNGAQQALGGGSIKVRSS